MHRQTNTGNDNVEVETKEPGLIEENAMNPQKRINVMIEISTEFLC